MISSPHYHTHRSTIVLHFLYLSYTTPSGISDELFCQAFSFDTLFCQASRSSCFLLWASFHATSYSGLAYMTILSPGFLPWDMVSFFASLRSLLPPLPSPPSASHALFSPCDIMAFLTSLWSLLPLAFRLLCTGAAPLMALPVCLQAQVYLRVPQCIHNVPCSGLACRGKLRSGC